MKFSLFRRALAALVTACLFLSAASPARATNSATTFTSGSDMSVGGNYSPSIAPTTATTTDVQLSGSYAGTTLITSGSALSFGTLDDLDATQALVITNNTANGTLQLNTAANGVSGVAGDLLYVAAGGNLTIQSGSKTLTLNLAATGNIDDAGTLTLAGPIAIIAAQTITFTGGGTTTVSGATTATSGTIAVNDSGGTVILSGNNLSTGGVTLTSGTLRATTSTGALGAGTLSLGGGQLQLAGALNFARNTTVTANTTITSDNASSGAGTTDTLGTLSIGAQTLTIAGGSNVTSGTAGITFGAPTLTGSATFNLTGPANGGITLLTLGAITGGTNGLTLTGTGNFAQSGAWTGSAPSSLILGAAFSGTATLNQTNTFTGGVAINGGTVIATTAGGLGKTSAQVIFGGGTLDLRAAATTFTSGINTSGSGGTILVEPAAAGNGVTHTLSLANTLGSSTIVLSPGSLTASGSNYGLTLSGANSFSGANTNATFTINGNGGGNGTLTLSGGFNNSGNTNTLTFNAGAGSGVDSATISGAFTGTAGTLVLAGNAPVTIGSLTTTANALEVSGSGTYAFNGASTFTGGVILNNASATVIATTAGGLGATSGKVKFNVAGTTLDLQGATVTYTSGIDSSANGATITVDPASAGNGVTNTLSLANTLGGNTIVMSTGALSANNTNYGLTLSGANSFSAANTNAAFTINGNGTGNGTLTLSGGFNDNGNTNTLTFNTGLGSGTNSATISGAFAGAAGTLILTGDAAVTVGALTTTANAVQVSSTTGGVYTFNGASTFTGGVTINNGLVLASLAGVAGTSGPLGTGTATVNSNSELRATIASALLGSSSVVLNSGTLRLFNAATTNFGGNLLYTAGGVILDRTASGAANTDTMGTLSIGGATLAPTTANYTSAPTLVFGATTLTGNPVFDTTNASITLGALNDGGAARTITVQGANLLTLSAAATSMVSGAAFTINSGVLASSAAGALSIVATTANTTTVTVNSGGELRGTIASAFLSSGAGTPSEAINLSGGTVRLSNLATTTFGGDLAYTSGTVILDRTASGAANTDTMGTLSIGGTTLSPMAANYTSAPTLVFGSTTLTGSATFSTANANITLGNIGDGGSGYGVIGSSDSAGTLTLSGTGNFSGNLTVLGGTVYGTGSNAFGTGNIVLGASGDASNATLEAGNGRTFTNPISIATGYSGAATITFDTNTATTLSGAISLNGNNLTVSANTTNSSVNAAPFLSGGITGTGNVTFNFPGTSNGAAAGALGIGGTLNNIGSITVTGNGTPKFNFGSNTPTFSGVIGTNVTSVVANAPFATISFTGANTFTNNGTTTFGLIIKSGVVSVNATGGGAGAITLGDPAGGNATLVVPVGSILPNNLVVVNSPGTLTFEESGGNNTGGFSGNITLTGTSTLVIASQGGGGGGSPGFNLSGSTISGTGNLIFTNVTGATASGPTVANAINVVGTITNSATAAAASVSLNGNIGSNVTQLIQNSTAETMVLNGINTNASNTGGNPGTLVEAGALEYLKEVSLYDDGTSSWTAANIAVQNGGNITFRVGAAGNFTAADLATIVTNLVANGSGSTGFEPGSTLGIDTAGGSLTVATNIVDTAAGQNGNSAGLSLSKSGANTLTLSGTNSYTGVTTIGNGTLSVSSINSVNGGSPPFAASSLGAPITIANGTISIGSTTNAGGLTYTGPGETTDRVINMAGTTGGVTITQSGAGLLEFTSNYFNGSTSVNTFTVTGAGAKTLTLAGSTAGTGNIAAAIIDYNGSNKTSVTKSGTGQWTLSGLNSYSGATTISNGILSVTSLANGGFTGITVSTSVNSTTALLGSTTGLVNGVTYSIASANIPGGTSFTYGGSVLISLSANATATGSSTASIIGVANSLGISSNAAANLSIATGFELQDLGSGDSMDRNFTITGASENVTFDASGTGPLSMSGAAVYTTGSASGTFTFQGTNSGANTYGGVIANNFTAAIGVTKSGTGTWDLAGLNTYSGVTNVRSGVLSINTVSTGTNAQSLGAGATVNLGVSGTSSGTLQYTGGAGTLDKNINALGNGGDTVQNIGSGLLTLSGTLTKNGTTLTLDGGSNGITVSGQIVGSLAHSDLVVTDGTTTLTNANSYVGATTINGGGTLVASATGALGSTSSISVSGGGTLLVGGNASSVANNSRFNQSAPVTVTNGTIAMQNGTGGGVSESLGALTLSGNSTIDFGTGNSASSSTLFFGNSGALSLSGTLSVFDWTGLPYLTSTVADSGASPQDRLVFGAGTTLTTAQNMAIDFYSDQGTTFVGTGEEVSFGGNVEVVPIPEPATILAGLFVLGLIGYRERRRIGAVIGGPPRKGA